MVTTRSGPWRVLVADDSQEVRAFVATRLQKAGYHTIYAEDGASALRLIQEHLVDVALLDVILPGMTGLEVLKEARQTGHNLPILLFTGLGGLSTAIEAVKYDADDFLTMPVQAPTLDFLIQKALLTRQYKKEAAPGQELEGRLRHAQKLESIGKLAAGVAHDLSNLMTIVLSHSHRLSTSLAVPDALRQTLKELHSSAEQASSLARQLLAFGRKQKSDSVRLDLNAIIREMDRMLSRVLGGQCRLHTDVPAAPLYVQAALGCVEQVLMNLVLNARDAMPDGGAIIISARALELADAQAKGGRILPAGRYVCLRVADTGVGMDESTRARLFEPFFTTKAPGQGTGLGLAIVGEIVEECGGRIEVASAPGRGTTFTIYLPEAIEAPQAPSSPSPNGTSLPRGNETILLVEDEQGVRHVVSETLRHQGYTVLEASDGPEAVPLSASHAGTIHLLMTDLTLPHMGGEELARRLRHQRDNLRVLFISGYHEGADLDTGRHGPHSSFLQKPFRPDVLACKVREVLDA